jgi:hypothetical protein
MRASLDAVADSEKLILSPTSHDMTMGICAVVKEGRAAKVEVVTFCGGQIEVPIFYPQATTPVFQIVA